MADSDRHRGAPGYNEEASLAKRGFTGRFQDLDLPTLIQMFAWQGVTGRLRVESGSSRGEIYYRGGEVVHVVCDGLRGLEGFRRIFSWDGGEVFLEQGVLPGTETIGLPWHGLLVRMMAEREEQQDRHPEPYRDKEREGAASQAMRFHRLYSRALSWREVQSCFIYSMRKLRIMRPTSTLPVLQTWSRMFVEILQKASILQILDGDKQPHLIGVAAAGTQWVLIPEDAYFVALQVRRGVDMDDLFRRVKTVLNEEE